MVYFFTCRSHIYKLFLYLLISANPFVISPCLQIYTLIIQITTKWLEDYCQHFFLRMARNIIYQNITNDLLLLKDSTSYCLPCDAPLQKIYIFPHRQKIIHKIHNLGPNFFYRYTGDFHPGY